jgi:undecaprenyl diphosphate synthase
MARSKCRVATLWCPGFNRNVRGYFPLSIFRRKKKKLPFEADQPSDASLLQEAQRKPHSLPQHVAIIMDGNGRWAKARGLPRIEGHRRGANSVRKALESCERWRIPNLTLYCFSSENWKRPQEELDFLMGLLKDYLVHERKTLVEKNIRLKIIGRRDGLPADVLVEMDKSIEVSKNHSAMTLCLAINYGARQEMVDAVRKIADEVREQKITSEAIDEDYFASRLYTAGIPDPDLLIRTSGELRISNFLLWQISYSELWVTSKAWPDFDEKDFEAALADYTRRQRRFGDIGTAST